MDCPKCKTKNSVCLASTSVRGDSIEVSLGCNHCGEASPYFKDSVETVNIDTIYKNWKKSY